MKAQPSPDEETPSVSRQASQGAAVSFGASTHPNFPTTSNLPPTPPRLLLHPCCGSGLGDGLHHHATRTPPRLLLHTCCGVCASHCVRVLKADGWTPVLFFSDFNLWPHEEYLRRRAAAQRLAEAEDIDFVEDPPDHAQWKAEVAEGYEGCAEGGARCARCFRFSLTRAEAALTRLGCVAFTTSLTVSPHKRSALLHAIGKEVGGDRFLPYDFKKQGGFQASNRRAAELGLYRQIYCGCEFSVRHREPFAALLLGLGVRGRFLAQWALEHPTDLRVIALAEPSPTLRATWAERLGLPPAQVFDDWPAALGVNAECALIALPDGLSRLATQAALTRNLRLFSAPRNEIPARLADWITALRTLPPTLYAERFTPPPNAPR